MGLRISSRSTARHRRAASNLAIPGALGVATLLAAPWTNPGAPSTAATALTASSTPACYDMVSVTIAGRGDTPREANRHVVAPDGTTLPASMSTDYSSHWVDPVVNAPKGSVSSDSYAAMYVDYPADMASYENAVDAGVQNAETVIRTIQKSCPDTKFAIVGYSEGADVARRVAMEVGNQTPDSGGSYGIVDPDNVVGVVILADSGRQLGGGAFPGAADEYGHPDNFDVVYQKGKTGTSGRGALPGTSGSFGALDGKVASFCAEGDLTCSAPENIALLQLAVNVGRQVNVDRLQREGLTPETGQELALVVGKVVLAAFADIASQDDWMRSDETFLDVLVKVSDPAYKPGTDAVSSTQQPLSSNRMVDLAYLPDKIRKEVIGFIRENENTIQVAMSDPYQQTLGEGTGHHFDYWRDANAANGKPMTSAEYAAAWLTHLAQEADADQAKKAAQPRTSADTNSTAKLAASDTTKAQAQTLVATDTPSAVPTTTTVAPTTTVSVAATTTAATTAPSTAPEPTSTTTDAPTTTTSAAPTTTEQPTTEPEQKAAADVTTESAVPTTTEAVPAQG